MRYGFWRWLRRRLWCRFRDWPWGGLRSGFHRSGLCWCRFWRGLHRLRLYRFWLWGGFLIWLGCRFRLLFVGLFSRLGQFDLYLQDTVFKALYIDQSLTLSFCYEKVPAVPGKVEVRHRPVPGPKNVAVELSTFVQRGFGKVSHPPGHEVFGLLSLMLGSDRAWTPGEILDVLPRRIFFRQNHAFRVSAGGLRSWFLPARLQVGQREAEGNAPENQHEDACDQQGR